MMAPKTELTVITLIPVNPSRRPEVLGIAEGHDRAHAVDVALKLAAGKHPSAALAKTDSSLHLKYNGRIEGRLFFKRTTSYEVS